MKLPALNSVSTRLALWFALLAFCVAAGVGYSSYLQLRAQIFVRDDAALLTRVDQIRTLMRNEDVRDLIRDKPQLFANMLGNTESLLVLRFDGEKPLIEINPGATPVPDVEPVPPGAPLTLAAIHHTTASDGTPFIYVAAEAEGADTQRLLRIVSGRLMTERTRVLAEYRSRILWLALGGGVLAALVAYWLAKRSIAVLGRLSARTASIGMENLSSRIELENAPTELRGLVNSVNGMLGRLERGFNQLSQVSADMAHDLRTPIGNMMGQTEVGLSKPRDQAYYERLLGSNFEELQRLSRMIDNMLFLARTEQADCALDLRKLDIEDEFSRIQEYFEGVAEEKGVRLEHRGQAELKADPQLLQRALANLLANAIRHADPGTAVAMVAEAVPEGTALYVENAGAAIAPEHLDRLFNRFYRADGSRQGSTESSGLGLSIVRSIMSLHGGQWRVSSSERRTRFTLIFPS